MGEGAPTVRNAGVGIQEVDAEGRYLSVNETFTRMAGYTLEDFGGVTFFDLIADETGRGQAREAHARLVRGDTDTVTDERRYTDKHGRSWWAEVRMTAVRDEEGRFLHTVRVVQDVTERRTAAERQALLAREVDHRAKNVLAVVQATLRLTRASDLPAFVRAVEGRVGALARAQTLLAKERWAGADLRELVRGELAAFPGGAERAALDGPPVALPVEVAQPLSMAVHELATNPVKHGAPSAPAGRVSASWRRDPATGALRLRWAETGGLRCRGRRAARLRLAGAGRHGGRPTRRRGVPGVGTGGPRLRTGGAFGGEGGGRGRVAGGPVRRRGASVVTRGAPGHARISTTPPVTSAAASQRRGPARSPSRRTAISVARARPFPAEPPRALWAPG